MIIQPNKKVMTKPLTIVQTGMRVRIITVETCSELQERLAAMGLLPGVEIDVLRNTDNGPFIIAVKGSRIMLGHGIAGKIAVA